MSVMAAGSRPFQASGRFVGVDPPRPSPAMIAPQPSPQTAKTQENSVVRTGLFVPSSPSCVPSPSRLDLSLPPSSSWANILIPSLFFFFSRFHRSVLHSFPSTPRLGAPRGGWLGSALSVRGVEAIEGRHPALKDARGGWRP